MATAKSEERHVLTILWRIEDIELCEKLRIIRVSHLYTLRTFESRKFEMNLFWNGISENDEKIRLELHQIDVPVSFSIDCEWSFIGGDGSPLVIETSRNHDMARNGHLIMSDGPTHEEVFVSRRSTFVTRDALTLRFRIWKSHGNLSSNEFIFFRSKLETTEHSFLWTIPGLSDLQLNQNVTTAVRYGNTFTEETFLLKFKLKGDSLENARAFVELEHCSIFGCFIVVTLKISALDKEGIVISSTKVENEEFTKFSKTCTLPTFVCRKQLLSKKSDCLGNDILTLRCEMHINSYHAVINKYYYGVSNQEIHDIEDSSKLLVAGYQPSQLSNIQPHASKQKIMQPDIAQQSVMKPDISQQSIMQPDISQQSIMQPDVSQQSIMQPDIAQQSVMKPYISQQSVIQPAVSQQSVMQPDIALQSVLQPDISQQRRDSLILLGEDLLNLYREQCVTDFEIHSGENIFPVHKNILSARSPVFKAMFSRMMKETDSLNIPDLDAPTLERLLTFFCGWTLEPDLHLDEVAMLYGAAVKYQVESLKQLCSSILRCGVSVSNVGDILALADRHRDEQLKLFVHDFLLENFEVVLRSKEWKNFQQREPALAENTVLQTYRKKCEGKH